MIEKRIINNGKPEKSVMQNVIKNYYEVNESNSINLLSKELQYIFKNHNDKKQKSNLTANVKFQYLVIKYDKFT